MSIRFKLNRSCFPTTVTVIFILTFNVTMFDILIGKIEIDFGSSSSYTWQINLARDKTYYILKILGFRPSNFTVTRSRNKRHLSSIVGSWQIDSGRLFWETTPSTNHYNFWFYSWLNIVICRMEIVLFGCFTYAVLF